MVRQSHGLLVSSFPRTLRELLIGAESCREVSFPHSFKIIDQSSITDESMHSRVFTDIIEGRRSKRVHYEEMVFCMHCFPHGCPSCR